MPPRAISRLTIKEFVVYSPAENIDALIEILLLRNSSGDGDFSTRTFFVACLVDIVQMLPNGGSMGTYSVSESKDFYTIDVDPVPPCSEHCWDKVGPKADFMAVQKCISDCAAKVVHEIIKKELGEEPRTIYVFTDDEGNNAVSNHLSTYPIQGTLASGVSAVANDSSGAGASWLGAMAATACVSIKTIGSKITPGVLAFSVAGLAAKCFAKAADKKTSRRGAVLYGGLGCLGTATAGYIVVQCGPTTALVAVGAAGATYGITKLWNRFMGRKAVAAPTRPGRRMRESRPAEIRTYKIPRQLKRQASGAGGGSTPVALSVGPSQQDEVWTLEQSTDSRLLAKLAEKGLNARQVDHACRFIRSAVFKDSADPAATYVNLVVKFLSEECSSCGKVHDFTQDKIDPRQFTKKGELHFCSKECLKTWWDLTHGS
jgi:hypothetical protein